MKLPTIINLKGYSDPDPLDKAGNTFGFILFMFVNFLLTMGLFYIMDHFKIVYFNGFVICKHYFRPVDTMILEGIINCLIFPLLILSLRKASSLIPYLVVFLPYYIGDLYIDSHYRDGIHNASALWDYYDGSLVSEISIHALKYFVTISVDGIILGILGLFFTRLLAEIFCSKRAYSAGPTEKQVENLFTKDRSNEDVEKPKRDWAFYILRILGFIYLIYLCILLLGKLGERPWPAAIGTLIHMTYENPALAINTYFKITLMIMLAFLAAYNKRLRFYACIALLTGHLISTAYSLIFHFCSNLNATYSAFLLTSAEADGLMVVIFLIILLKFKKDSEVFAPDKDFPIDFSIPMTLLRWMYRIMGIVFLLVTIGIVFIRVKTSGHSGLSAVFGSPDPMIGNTITLYGTLTIISFLLVKREQLRRYFFNTLVVPLSFGSIVAIVWIIVGSMRSGVWFYTRYGTEVQVDWYFVLHGIFGFSLVALMVGLTRMYYKVDYVLNAVSPSAANNIMALTDAFYECDKKQPSAVLHLIDQYEGGIRGRKRGLLNAPFALFENVLSLCYGLRPPFSAMERDEQRYYLRKYYITNELERKRSCIPPLAEASYTVGTILNSTIMFANYSYVNERFKIGYIPPDARDRLQGEDPSSDPPFAKVAPLPEGPTDPNNFKPDTPAGFKLVAPRVTTYTMEDDVPDETDYLIIGSGPGGATTAYRLACAVKEPSRILMVDRGYRYQPMQDFNDNEIDMMKKVYKEGGTQLTKKFDMILAQGECVGGGSVVNNAICFEIPDSIKAKWQSDFGIDVSDLAAEYDTVAKEINITQLDDKGINQVVAGKFKGAVDLFNTTLSKQDKLLFEIGKANHLNNNGDGNWNIGNKRMRKRSMLETYIPWAESKGVKVISNMTAVRFTTSGGKRANFVILRADNGQLKKVKVNKAVIVAGGVIASSNFLTRSEVKNTNVGLNVSCNFAFPIAFDYDEEIKAYDGEQITFAALDPHHRAAFETYYNPPSAFALGSVPYSFERRIDLMARYKNMLNFGCLVGSEPNGTVLNKPDLLNGQSFNWFLGDTDVKNIKYAFNTLIQIGKLSGSTKIILPTKPGISFNLTDSEINNFTEAFKEYPLRITDIQTYSAHPQGGNMMAGKNSQNFKNRVVDEDFRVQGYENVFVADASLFPTSITVNPQWTIMAMSSLAAKSVLKFFP